MLFGLQRFFLIDGIVHCRSIVGWNRSSSVDSSSGSVDATSRQSHPRAADKLTHAKRVNSGDVVTAHLVPPAKLPNGIELAKGTKLVGTITDVKAKADKEGPSKMGLLFTTVAPNDGKKITVSMVLVTLAPHLVQKDVDLLAADNPFFGTEPHAGGNRIQHTQQH